MTEEAHYTESMTAYKVMELLRNELSLDTKENHGYYGEYYVTVELKLGEQVLSSVYVNMPKQCSCRCGSGY